MIKEISAENYLGIEIQEHELFDHEHLFVFEDDDKNFKAFLLSILLKRVQQLEVVDLKNMNPKFMLLRMY